MTDEESRVLVRAALVLTVAGVIRWGVEAVRPVPTLPVDGPSQLEALDSAAAAAAEEEARRSLPLGPDERVDPNRAGEVELDRLPGVGPAVARAIVASREADGAYRALSDLERVRGIGPATVERLAPHLDLGSGPPPRLGSRRPAADVGVDPNRASASELEALPGIGPALARRIVESRESEGPFARPDDLLRVRGIGPVVLERIRPGLRLGGG